MALMRGENPWEPAPLPAAASSVEPSRRLTGESHSCTWHFSQPSASSGIGATCDGHSSWAAVLAKQQMIRTQKGRALMVRMV